MTGINKHRKISAVLHILHGAFLLLLGYVLFGLSGAFVSCSTTAINDNPGNCIIVSGVLFGIPLLITLLTIIALVTYGKVARMFLKFYAVIAAITLTPTGLLAGFHTQKLLAITKESYSKSSNLTGTENMPLSSSIVSDKNVMRHPFQLHKTSVDPKKDWEDVAFSWPFSAVIGLALIGLIFSKIVFTDIGYIVLLIISILVGSYLFVAVLLRMKKGKIDLQGKSKSLRAILYFVLFYSFSYVAVLHGATAVLGAVVFTPQEKIIAVHEKSRTAGGRVSTKGALHIEGVFLFPSRALHFEQGTLSKIKEGDSILLVGRGSWYGMYVDKIKYR